MFAVLLTLLGAYAILIALLYAAQRLLIYHPDKRIQNPESYGLFGFVEHFITAADGVKLQIWHHPADKGMPTICYFHGNAYHMGSRAGIYAALTARGFGVLALSYRGYGKSQGHPSERGLYNDARAAIGFLVHQRQIPLKRIILFGESLGTGVAVQMALEYQVAALVLQAPYKSVAIRAAELYRYIPVLSMIKDRYDSIGKIRKVKCPLLVFHGELDPTIPVDHGRAIFEAATCPKCAYFFPHILHNNFDSQTVSAHILAFAKEYQLID